MFPLSVEMETEFEFRFGTHTPKGFSSCVSRDIYHILYNRCIHIGIVFGNPYVNYVKYYDGHIRSTNNCHQIKKTLYKRDFYMGTYSLRYCESTEEDIPESEVAGKVAMWGCNKSRVTGVYKQNVKIEFTILDRSVYQVEIEIKDRAYVDDASDLLETICRWSYMPRQLIVVPVSIPSYRGLMDKHNRLFRYAGYQAWYRPTKPVDIPIPIPDLQEYVVTYKYDGVRGFLCRLDSSVYWVNIQGMVCLDTISIPFNTILDVECMNDHIIVLDVLFWNGMDMRSQPMIRRIESLDTDAIPPFIRPLQIFSMARIKDVWESSLSEGRFDGIILRNQYAKYSEEKSLKVKPINKQTIDLDVRDDGVYAYSKLMRGSIKWADIGSIIGGDTIERGIWEFQRTDGGMLPVRRREDRRYPNTVETINSVLFISRGCEIVDTIFRRVVKGE
jgi:hypothetical protein